MGILSPDIKVSQSPLKYMRVEMVFLIPSQKKLEVLSIAICRALQSSCEGGSYTILAQRVGFWDMPPTHAQPHRSRDTSATRYY